MEKKTWLETSPQFCVRLRPAAARAPRLSFPPNSPRGGGGHPHSEDENPEDERGLNALPEAAPQLGGSTGLLTHHKT